MSKKSKKCAKSLKCEKCEIMPVDVFMRNHCPWKACGDEEVSFEGVQEERDAQNESRENLAIVSLGSDFQPDTRFSTRKIDL